MADEPEPLQSLNVSDLWDYSVELEYLHRLDQDLQLAAELGKTLLERNKELETALKQHQNVIEDQAQEIEYLTKQTVALREVNDSRLRIYEQLEVSIQDLERANHRLVLENSAEKKHIKSLNATIESLEAKCEELQTTIDDLRLQTDILKKKSRRTSNDGSERRDHKTATVVSTESLREDSNSWVSPNTSAVNNEETGCPTQLPSPKLPSPKPVDLQTDQYEVETNTEQLSQLLSQLSKTRAQGARDERRIAELEEQLSTVIQQNQALENQVVQLSHRGNDEGMKSMHEELTTLEEVRQGQLCSRCLRSVSTDDDVIPDDDDSSMLDALMTSQHRTEFTMDIQVHPENQSSPITSKQSTNPYKDLVEKYEALAEIHRKPLKSNQFLSLQEEMQISGEFNTLSMKDTDEESGHGDSLKLHKKSRKTFSTPTDLSEAETSSSGFADETSNKYTQTEGRVGSFLCTIADGEDCKFSIYDDASPIDSRFRDSPEYRDLFKEIFKVLKKAAENKEEGDDLPLLDDYTAGKLMPKVPPVTPSAEQIPEFPDDDTQSVVSSTMSEVSISQNEPTTVIENIIQAQNQPIPEAEPEKDICLKQEQVLRPLVRQNLDYISVEVRKRSSSKRKNKYIDRADSSVTHIIGSPKINYSSRPNSGKKRREQARHNTSADNDGSNWNGNTLQFFSSSRSLASPTPSQGSTKYEFKPSSASQDLHKLKKLDLSYAEVLRNADNKKRERDMYRQRQRK